MNAAGQVTPQNAPRDVEKLQLLGPFMLKRLMEVGLPMIGVQFDEATRNAFFKKPINDRASAVLELLKQIDSTGGGTPAPAPVDAPAPPAATDEKPARTPVSRGSKTNGAGTNGVATNGASDDGIAILKGISAVLTEMGNSVEAMAKTVKSVESGAKKISDIDAKIDMVLRMQHLNMGVLQQIVQNGVPIASMGDVLEAVKTEYNEIEEAISALISGKIVPQVEPDQLWPGCIAPTREDISVVEDNLDKLSSEELFDLAGQIGLLVNEEMISPDVLRARIRRASC